MLSEEGLCATVSLYAEVWSPGRHCSKLKGIVHNSCSLSMFAAGRMGVSAAPDIPDSFTPLPVSDSTKHLTSNSETDLWACSDTHVLPYVFQRVEPTWTSKAAPLLLLPPPSPALPPACVRLPGAAGGCTVEQALREITEHPGTSQPISSPPTGVSHFTPLRLPLLLISAASAFLFPLILVDYHIHQHEILMLQQRGDTGKSLFSKHYC